jgi:acyl-CoA reductase-like NAD-dependent aldehyde dehydrogenase
MPRGYLRKAGFPDDLIQVVVGAAETGTALVDNTDMVSFTGSIEVGKQVMRRAAERLIPVSLELGGKDPMIVLKDSDIERAANACVWGSLVNSGQACISIERVYVEEAIYEGFVNKVVEKVRALRQGPGDQEVDLGGMISETQLNKVSAQIDEAIRKGAKALTGGSVNPDLSGLYYLPTVLIDVKHDTALIKDETFGPVIPIMKVPNASEALRLANDSRYGLNASVFARDKKVAWQMAEKLQAGAVCINDALINYAIQDAPMGGIKDSGYGRRHGAEGIRKFCYQKTIVIDRLGWSNELAWFPLTHKKTQAVRRLISLLWRSGWRNKFRLPRRER